LQRSTGSLGEFFVSKKGRYCVSDFNWVVEMRHMRAVCPNYRLALGSKLFHAVFGQIHIYYAILYAMIDKNRTFYIFGVVFL